MLRPHWGRGGALWVSLKGTCRITANNTQFTKSAGGYSAWTASSPGSGSYTAHPGDYCDCSTPGPGCSHWEFKASGLTEDECEQKCTSLKCSCFDFSAGGHPKPHYDGKRQSQPIPLLTQLQNGATSGFEMCFAIGS